MVGFSKSLRLEAAAFGVNVSVVCPGFLRTGIFEASPLIRVDKQKLLAQLPPKIMAPKQAAQIILKGVRKNKAVIVFPFIARIFWWLYRLHPVFLAPIHRKMIADFRRLRTASE